MDRKTRYAKRTIGTLPLALAVGLTAVALGACENRNIPPLGRDFGNATEQNMSLQIINPEPVYADSGAPDMDGTKADGAIDRYKSGSVIAPQAEDTGGVGDN